jgi:hypothetical protein
VDTVRDPYGVTSSMVSGTSSVFLALTETYALVPTHWVRAWTSTSHAGPPPPTVRVSVVCVVPASLT